MKMMMMMIDADDDVYI